MRDRKASMSLAVRSTNEKFAMPKILLIRSTVSAGSTSFLKVSNKRAGRLRISFAPRSLTAASTFRFSSSVKYWRLPFLSAISW